MTVAELIEVLEAQPRDAQVILYNGNSEDASYADHVDPPITVRERQERGKYYCKADHPDYDAPLEEVMVHIVGY